MTEGTHDWNDPEEFERGAQIVSANTVPEMVRFFRGFGAQEFAARIGLPVKSHRWQQCVAIKAFFREYPFVVGGAPDEPVIADPVVPPFGGGDKPADFCNCPDGKGLRWEKHDSGELVTWDIVLLPEYQHMHSEILQCVLYANRAWEAVCGIKFQQNPRASRVEADINWGMEAMDDWTLGAAWMPRGGTSMDMGGRHPLCGDISYNATFPGWDRRMRKGVGVHELGHATGQEHVDIENDSIMQSYYDENIILPSVRDGARATIKYPVRLEA